MMKQIWACVLFFLNCMPVFVTGKIILPSTVNRQPSTSNGLNREAFYKAMEENKKDLVNAQLEELKSAPEESYSAFLGAMLMKRASFPAAAGVKLRYFKQGHKMLEAAIKKEPENAEYRLLRLMVQEHAPGVLGYRDDIQKDCELIRKSYKSQSPEIQEYIGAYNKKSKFLKLDVS
jgi:hypothetical protein